MKPIEKQRFVKYMKIVEQSTEDLAFVLSNLGIQKKLNFDRNSLKFVLEVFKKTYDDPEELEVWKEGLIHCVPLFLGNVIAVNFEASWKAVTEKGLLSYGPYRVTGFGDLPWESYYPLTSRNKIKENPNEIIKIFDECHRIWDLSNILYKGTLAYLKTQEMPCLISDIAAYLEKEGTIPNRRYGEARYKQYEKRIGYLLRIDRRFRKIPKQKAMSELLI